VKAEFDNLRKPLDRQFQTLKDKLDRIPTRKQRADAAAAPPDPAEVRSRMEERARESKKEKPESRGEKAESKPETAPE
jgi:hypothetical protein